MFTTNPTNAHPCFPWHFRSSAPSGPLVFFAAEPSCDRVGNLSGHRIVAGDMVSSAVWASTTVIDNDVVFTVGIHGGRRVDHDPLWLIPLTVDTHKCGIPTWLFARVLPFGHWCVEVLPRILIVASE